MMMYVRAYVKVCVYISSCVRWKTLFSEYSHSDETEQQTNTHARVLVSADTRWMQRTVQVWLSLQAARAHNDVDACMPLRDFYACARG